ncbi:chemotaxis protein CheA [Urbifossiella limnaea]|uniref:histidine kinase n=1 Tax=Urbifossiella limnaea TaxID=2528023 RepID=A0A517XWU7_9BACT|nr:chemotaxis protein CheA [Urbifossiella limnaea]QDU21968.1 Chemotaxis protein CheA [Urbifossiella limnaea]
MNDIIRDFLLETHESLAQLDLDLVALEKTPRDRETLDRVFRALHTVKGTAGFLGLDRLQAVSHAGENLLSRLRAGEIIFNPEIATAMLAVVDAVRRILAGLEATGQEEEADFSDIIRRLEALTKGAASNRAQPAAPPPPVVVGPTRVTVLPPEPPPAPVLAAVSMAEPAEGRHSAVSDGSIRVDVGLLDKLMTLVGELVLARNQLVGFRAAREDPALHGPVQRLDQLTTELQAGVMKTRMQPVGSLWGKFPRVVRDLAAACGKQVRLDLDGGDTDLDKSVVEAIRDPLTHIVRNAVDHGIEPPADRLSRGKPAEGRLHLHAAHEGGKVVIRVSDDGGGIDPGRVRAKAVAAGLLSADLAARQSDREAVNLVFLPGFSTADRVTHFSGRGVGMDVVRTNVEKIGGTVDLESRPGGGTTVSMKIPLTLAIIPALTVTCGGDRYCIPQVSLLELVRLDGDQAHTGVEYVHGAPVYRLRGNLLPLVHLDRLLRVDPTRPADGGATVVVIQADDRPFGLVVDDIHDTGEIVVKPLRKQLKGAAAFSGATILGDGRVALILDVLGLAQRAGVVSGPRDRAAAERPSAVAAAQARETVLLVASGGGRMAIPLAAVDRLEEFPRASVERVGGRSVVQYRGEILPLVRASRPSRHKRAAKRRPDEQRRLQVAVCAADGRRVGLVVSRLLDVVEEAVTARAPAGRAGVLFTAVVQDRVTEFLDIAAVVKAAHPAAVSPE